jgi:hypothetical protein
MIFPVDIRAPAVPAFVASEPTPYATSGMEAKMSHCYVRLFTLSEGQQ